MAHLTDQPDHWPGRNPQKPWQYLFEINTLPQKYRYFGYLLLYITGVFTPLYVQNYSVKEILQILSEKKTELSYCPRR